MPGITMSVRRRSNGPCSLMASRASVPLERVTTSCPARLSASIRKFSIESSSSARRIFAIVLHHPVVSLILIGKIDARQP